MGNSDKVVDSKKNSDETRIRYTIHGKCAAGSCCKDLMFECDYCKGLLFKCDSVSNCTALCVAVVNGNFQVANILFERMYENKNRKLDLYEIRFVEKNTSLHLAVLALNVNIIQMILAWKIVIRNILHTSHTYERSI
jgi:hypothetical protein